MDRFLDKIDKEKLTYFKSCFEGENYLKRLGAKVIKENGFKKYKINGLTFLLSSEYDCLYLEEDLDYKIFALLQMAGFEKLYGHYHLIDSLELLVYLIGLAKYGRKS